MHRDIAKDQAKFRLKNYIQTKGINADKSFRCVSRNHEDKNPSMRYDSKRNKIKCFSCGVDWDIFDLISDEYGITDDKAKFDKTYEVLGIVIDQSTPTYTSSDFSFEDLTNEQSPMLTDDDAVDKANAEEALDELKPFSLKAQDDINAAKTNVKDPNCVSYLSKRGISLNVALRHGVGYTSDWQHPTALADGKNPPPSPRVIIPTGDSSYLARSIRDEGGCTKMKVGSGGTFNIEALNSESPCFVVEGEFDALSFLEIGFNAVALGSTENVASFLDKVKSRPPSCPLILALDADDSGKKATTQLEKGLSELNIKYIVSDLLISTDYNDPNNFLVGNRDVFKQAAREALTKLDDQLSDDNHSASDDFDSKRAEYWQTSASNQISAFRKNRENTTKAISTGFSKLDDVLGGGLYDALYVIGAISSLGKTTLVIQIADYLASQGHDVLYFSLEMSKFEIMSKSISRHTYWHCYDNGIPMNLSKDTREVATGQSYNNSTFVSFTAKECDVVYCAEESYAKYADKLFIHEGAGNENADDNEDKDDESTRDFGIKEIKSVVKEHIKYRGKVPIIIVDYLQILDPENTKASDKQNTDKAVLGLKHISRKHRTPVIAISSLNRQSYKDPINMEAFKESGAIEYSSDVLIGLELKGVGVVKSSKKGTEDFDVDKAKKQNPREVTLKILKNRNGKTGCSIEFKSYTKHNLFREDR